TVTGMANATLGVAAVKPAPIWEIPETVAELKQEINRAKAFLNDRDFKMSMVEKSEQVEQLQKQGEALEDEIEEIKKKFTLGGVFSRRKEIGEREKELKLINDELSVVQAEEQKMRKTHDAAFKRLEKMDEKLCALEGRTPPKPKNKGFKL
ncbi:MAG: hypothetical protein ACAH80_07915, partial [Alphaproteobacteria bacterium]